MASKCLGHWHLFMDGGRGGTQTDKSKKLISNKTNVDLIPEGYLLTWVIIVTCSSWLRIFFYIFAHNSLSASPNFKNFPVRKYQLFHSIYSKMSSNKKTLSTPAEVSYRLIIQLISLSPKSIDTFSRLNSNNFNFSNSRFYRKSFQGLQSSHNWFLLDRTWKD